MTAKAVNEKPVSATNASGRSSSDSDGAVCVHHWVLGEPVGKTVSGRCKSCGSEREFPSNPQMNFTRIPNTGVHPSDFYSVLLAREGMR